jgi:hypothetical protein
MHRAIYDGNVYPPELSTAIRNSQYESSRTMVPDDAVSWSTLDEVIAEVGLIHVDRIKVDIEGGELGLLQGADHALAELRPQWLIEDHSRVYPWVAQQGIGPRIAELLHEYGYAVQRVVTPVADYLVASPDA